jgi:hypothetical protein
MPDDVPFGVEPAVLELCRRFLEPESQVWRADSTCDGAAFRIG